MEAQNCEEPLQIMELFKNRLCMDAIWDESVPLEERAGVTEDDLPPFYFDFEEQWAKINAEMKDKVEDYSELFAEIVEANKEVAVSEMGIRVDDEDILDGLFGENVLMIPPMETVRDKSKVNDSTTRKRSETFHKEGPLVKKIKGGESLQQSNRTFVFVNEVATNEKKVITLRKGEKLPAGYEMASIQGDLPVLPNELAFISLPKLKDLITNNKSSTSPSKNQAKNASSPTPTWDSSKPTGLNSLSDLMTSEMEKKSRLKYKQQQQRGTSPSRIVSILNKTTSSTSGQKNLVPASSQTSLEISPVTSLHQLQLEKSNFGAKRFSLPNQPKTVPVQPREAITFGSSVQPVGTVATQKPSLSVLPLGQNSIVMGKVARTVFICKLCGEMFQCYNDHLFRKHMFAKHEIEIADDNQYFEDSKATSCQFLRCKKCKATVPSRYEEHKLRCLPLVTREEAFEEIDMTSFPSFHHVCGIGECREAFKSRYLLHGHLIKEHKPYSRKMILDPYFRCSQCLKRFQEAYALGKHVPTCTEAFPRKETMIELIQGMLDCDLCGEKHKELGMATSCSFNNQTFRCVLCLAVIKNRKNIYKHLNEYHGLKISKPPASNGKPGLILDCPWCDVKSSKYTVIFSHIVTEHYTTIFVNNPGIFSLPKTTTIVQQKQVQGRSESNDNGATRRPSPSVSSSSSSTATGNPVPVATKKLPELSPITATTSATVGMPPGIRINTNRLSPLVTVASGDVMTVSPEQSRAGPALMRNSQSQIYPQNKIILLHNPNPLSVPAKGNNTMMINLQRFGQPQPGTTRTMLVSPSTTAQPQQIAIEIPASIRQPMSGLAKTGTSSVPRQPQVQLVRPLPTAAPLIIRPNAHTTATSQMRTSTVSTGASNTLTVSHTATASHSVSGLLQRNIVTGYAAGITSPPPLSTSANFVAPLASGEFTMTQPSTRGGTPIVSVQQPSIISTSSTLTINATSTTSNRPATTAASSASVANSSPTASAQSTASTIVKVTTTTGNNNTPVTATTTATVSPNALRAPAPPKQDKPASRIVTIGGRTIEYQVIQRKLAGSNNKTHTVTQSASGVTSVRHVPFPPNFKVPTNPSGSTVRLSGPSKDAQEKPKDGNGKPS